MYKKKLYVLLLICMLFAMNNSAIANQQGLTDTLKIYSELCGDYEFYFEERYSPIKIYLKGSTLMGQERGHDPITITPLNLDKLEFTAYNGEEYFKVTFIKDADGKIVRFILVTKEGEDTAERVFEKPKLRMFSVAELQADFKQLRKAMEANPAIIYQFTEKGAFDRLFDQQFEKIVKPMSTEEFRRIIAPVIVQVGCIHTSLWMPPGYWKNARAKLIPLRLVFLKSRGYVWRIYNETKQISEGSEIISINGSPVSEILDILKANISADGYNESYRTFKINEGFSYRYGLDFGYQDELEFVYQLPDQNDQQKIVLKAVDLETVEKHGMEKNSTEYNALDYTHSFKVLEEKNAAILTIRSFAFYNKPEILNSFIDSAFNKIHEKNIQNLILDIRNNDGGNPFCSVHLFSYLESRPLPYFAEEYGKYAQLAHPIPLAEKPFTGSLYTLINGDNVSTTPHFCALLKYHKIGIFVGTETGGTYTCNAATREIHLKHTRFIVLLSRKSFASAVKGFPRNKGIIPEYPVQPTIEDLIAGRDAVMEFTLKLIEM